MNDKNLKASNKKNAGKGNGNSIISSKNTNDNINDYVSGDAFPSSASHKFNKNTQNIDES
jgi:hypothetical protein